MILPRIAPKIKVTRYWSLLSMGNWEHHKLSETRISDNHMSKESWTTQRFTCSESHETEDLFIRNAHWGLQMHCNTGITFPTLCVQYRCTYIMHLCTGTHTYKNNLLKCSPCWIILFRIQSFSVTYSIDWYIE